MELQLTAWVAQEIDSSVKVIQQLSRLEDYHRFYASRFEEALEGHPHPDSFQAVRYKRKLRDLSEQIAIIEGLIHHVNLRQASLVSVLKVAESPLPNSNLALFREKQLKFPSGF